MKTQEQTARKICQMRGVDPDGEVHRGYPDAPPAYFNPAWQGYTAEADELVAFFSEGEAK